MVKALFLIPASFAQGQGGDKVDRTPCPGSNGGLPALAGDGAPLLDGRGIRSTRHQQPQSTSSPPNGAMKQMKAWGPSKMSTWKSGRLAMGWQIKHFYAAMETPVYAGVHRVPSGMDAGDERADHRRAGVGADPLESNFAKYHGKLKGKGAADVDPAPLTLPTRADATPSPTDEEILAGGGRGGGGRGAAAGAPGASGESAATGGRRGPASGSRSQQPRTSR